MDTDVLWCSEIPCVALIRRMFLSICLLEGDTPMLLKSF